MRILRRAAPQIAGALLVASCATKDPPPDADYVAMGSSFAAGPGVGDRDPAAPLLCGRSRDNYAHLVARRLDLTLDDVSCSGATVANVMTDGQARRPPQIHAVGSGTRLVTITVGGNDVSYLGNLAGQSCANARSMVPFLWRPIVCKVTPDDQIQRAFAVLPSRLGAMVDEVRRRAPRARVALIDYVTILPEHGACPAVAPLSPTQIGAARRYAARLSSITRQVAEAKGALFIPAGMMTSGHDVCSRDPWVFGFVFRSVPLTWGPFGYHPNGKAMSAIADAIVSRVR